MKKIFLIGWKDLTLAFRDRAALLLMLAAPFLLTLGLGFVTGSFSGGSSSGVGDIPVVLVNQDGGQLGDALVNVFRSQDLAGLVTPSELDDPAAARQQVDADQVAAAIIIPVGFTASIIPASGASMTSALSAPSVIRSAMRRFVFARISGETAPEGRCVARIMWMPRERPRCARFTRPATKSGSSRARDANSSTTTTSLGTASSPRRAARSW